MRLIVDLDGTICPIREDPMTYADLKPLPGAVEFLKEMKGKGHYIIIQTARNMKTQGSNIGKVIKNVGGVTLNWLEQYDVPYDEIFFGKPNGDIYIDDRAFRFQDWSQMSEEELLSKAKEK